MITLLNTFSLRSKAQTSLTALNTSSATPASPARGQHSTADELENGPPHTASF